MSFRILITITLKSNDMTIDDIKNLVSADESQTLELKKSTGELKDGMHSACAFLNNVSSMNLE